MTGTFWNLAVFVLALSSTGTRMAQEMAAENPGRGSEGAKRRRCEVWEFDQQRTVDIRSQESADDPAPKYRT